MASSGFVVTIVICTYNRAGPLAHAIESVMVQTLPDNRLFEILVIDDGSTDATAGVVHNLAARSRFPLRYMRVAHGGVAAARNAGVAHARGEWIAFFDDDQEAEADWLARLLGCAEETGADCVGGRVKVVLVDVPGNTRLDPTVRALLGDNGSLANPASPLRGSGNRVPGTGNALVRRSWFDRVKSFDVDLSCGEDAEWFRRARRLGAMTVFTPHAVIYHLTPASRLTSQYLFAVAARGATSQAMNDYKDGGSAVLLKMILRMIHLSLTAARLGLAHLLGDAASVLGRRCSIRFSRAYVATAAAILRRGSRTTSYGSRLTVEARP